MLRRVDQLGVAEPTLQRSHERRVIVELPGVYDPRQAVEVIGRTAELAFHPVLGVAEAAGAAPSATTPAADAGGLVLADEDGARLRHGPAALNRGGWPASRSWRWPIRAYEPWHPIRDLWVTARAWGTGWLSRYRVGRGCNSNRSVSEIEAIPELLGV